VVAFLIPFAMRAVTDTHVFVGDCMGAGACNAVIRVCLTNAQERNTLLDIFLARCEWTRVYCLWRPNLRDEGDNHLIELAVAAGADLIISRNVRDLRSGQLPFARLRVMTPEAFLKEI
jgi:predicted nucleic acid-binding protein